MTRLPDGRRITITSDRARFHARRLRLRVTANTPHQQLYPLIDILFEQNGTTTFSGHTLADRLWINQWNEKDRSFFLEWLSQPAQARIVEQARVRLLAENATTYDEWHNYPSRLYSPLHQRLQALTTTRATAEQWRRTLLNLRRDGLSDEAISWSGLRDFLSGYQAKEVVEKTALLDAIDYRAVIPHLCNELEYIKETSMPFTEVAKRLPNYQMRMAGYAVEEGDLAIVRHRCRTSRYQVGMLRKPGRTDVRWFVLGPYGQPVIDERYGRQEFASREAAIRQAKYHAHYHHLLRPVQRYSQRYEYMSLFGGEGYREWLVTLPDYPHSHFTAHYPERNVLLHIRTKERQSIDGKRLLFIEEMQSDWHQSSARYGLRSGIPRAPFRNQWVSLGLKMMLLHAVERGLDGIAWADATVHELRYDRQMSRLKRLYDKEIPRILQRLGRQWHVQIEQAGFATRSPWLHAARHKENWKVEGGAGKFTTRPRYDKEQARALIERHSKAVTLNLPVMLIPAEMREHIAELGLPLFGERI